MYILPPSLAACSPGTAGGRRLGLSFSSGFCSSRLFKKGEERKKKEERRRKKEKKKKKKREARREENHMRDMIVLRQHALNQAGFMWKRRGLK